MGPLHPWASIREVHERLRVKIGESGVARSAVSNPSWMSREEMSTPYESRGSPPPTSMSRSPNFRLTVLDQAPVPACSNEGLVNSSTTPRRTCSGMTPFGPGAMWILSPIQDAQADTLSGRIAVELP